MTLRINTLSFITFCRKKLRIMTFSIMTLIISTFIARILKITTLSKRTLRKIILNIRTLIITTLSTTLIIDNKQHSAQDLKNTLPSSIMPSVIILNVGGQ